ncbi:hypothetical protein AAHC03_020936 [Spirometra sp. Aus1]
MNYVQSCHPAGVPDLDSSCRHSNEDDSGKHLCLTLMTEKASHFSVTSPIPPVNHKRIPPWVPIVKLSPSSCPQLNFAAVDHVTKLYF